MHAVIEQLNVVGDSFVRFAAVMLLQSSILILLLLALDAFLRRRVRAVLRYWMWSLVLVKLVLPPSLGLPTGLTWWLGGHVDAALRTTPAAAALHAATHHAPPEPVRLAPAFIPHESYAVPRTIAEGPLNPPRLEPAAPTPTAAPQPVAPAAIVPQPLPLPHWSAIALIAYLAGVAILVLLLAQRARFIRGLVAQAREPNTALLALFLECRRRIPVRRRPRLKISPNMVSPAVCGLLHPTILVPEYLPTELDQRHIRAVLLHELAHIQRYDAWVNLGQILLQAVYFYNPLLWLANAIIRRVREQAVDEMVLVAMGEQAREYPETLVTVARLALARPALSLRLLGVVESRNALSGRVRHILGRPLPKTARLGTAGLALVALCAAVLLPMGARSPQASAAPEATPSSRPVAALAAPSNGSDDHRAAELSPQTQPTQGTDLVVEEMPEEFVDSSTYQGLGTLSTPDERPAFCNSDKPLYWRQKDSPYASALLFDESGGTGTGHDTLYVDLAGDKGFQEAKAYKRAASAPAGGNPVLTFRNVLLQRSSNADVKVVMKIVLRREGTAESGAGITYNGKMYPQNWARGTVAIGGRTVLAAIQDRNRNGRFSDRGNLNTAASDPPKCDYLILMPADAQAQPSSQQWAGAIKVPLTEFLVLNSGTYRVTAKDKADKVQLQIESVEIPAGKVEPVPAAQDGRLQLIGDRTIVVLTGVKDSVTLPADNYRTLGYRATPLAVAAQEGVLAGLPLGQAGATQEAISPSRILVHVVTAEDAKPLAGATITLSTYDAAGQGSSDYTTDPQGQCQPLLAPSGLITVKLSCDAAGRVPMTVRWDPSGSTPLPKQVTFAMETGTTIGGIVRNEDGQGISGAVVHLLVPRQGSPGQPYPDIYDRTFRTDTEGHWHCDYVPPKLNDVWIRLEHPDYTSDAVFGTTPKPPIEKLRDQTGEMIMKRGLVVTGVVVGPDGQPVADAEVKQGKDRFGSNFPSTRTDKQGRFTFPSSKPGTMILTTMAENFAPDCREVSILAKMEPLRIELKPGRKLTVRVIDGQGKPIPAVMVVADTWRGYRALEWRTETDAQGRFVWNNAPADAILFDILKQGYMDIRNVSLSASDQEQTVTMTTPLHISGAVVDASTGQPIPEFQLIPGIDWRNGNPVHWERDSVRTCRNGKYDMTFGFPRPAHLLRIEAPGYTPAVSRAFTDGEGALSIDFKLQKGQEIAGRVLDAAGRPVSKASVLLATPAQAVMIENGRDRQIHDGIRAETDAAGRFTLPTQTESYALVVLHDKGFARIDQKDFEASHEIRFSPWARVEGVLRIGAKPGMRLRVAMNYHEEYDPKAPRVTLSYNTTTDADGRFAFDRAIAGDAWVSREVKMSDNMTSYTQSTYIDVKSGETAKATVGGTGRPVVGKVAVPAGTDRKVNWACVHTHVSRKMSQAEPRVEPPADVKDKGTEAIQTWCAAWSRSDEGKAHLRAQWKTQRTYTFKVENDGSFRIEDVPAGDYTLQVSVYDPPPANQCGFGEMIGTAATQFTIGEMDTGRSDEPLDIGAVEMQVFKQLKIGQAAPPFEVPSLDGQTLKLSDYRGRYVLLDFWATWCGPCREETPALKSVNARFGKDPRFVIISLSLDPQQKQPQEYAEKEKTDWPQGFLGDWSKAKLPTEYGVRGVPAIFLIGPDGQVVAKDLRGPAIQATVEKSLASPQSGSSGAAATP